MSNETLNYRVLLVFAPLLLLTGSAGFVVPDSNQLRPHLPLEEQ